MVFRKLFNNKDLFLNYKIIFRNKYIFKYIFNPNRDKIMPRNKSYIHELQKQRKRLKAQSSKFQPQRICLQVVGNGTLSDPRCVILQTDHTNYVFNCGEGTQRLVTEYHTKLTKCEHFFVTRATWNNIGGIFGVILTLQITGVPSVKLHGPEGILDIMEGTKDFILLDELELLPVNINEKFVDQTMSIRYITINHPSKQKNNEHEVNNLFVTNTNDCDHEINSNGKRIHSHHNSMPLKTKNNNHVNRIDDLVIFVCKMHDKLGTLNHEKCIEEGVEDGPDMGKLKNGMDVTLSNGKLIRSKDVVMVEKKGPLIIIMECPSEDWIDNIVTHPTFLNYQAKTAVDADEIAQIIVHFTPGNVLKNSKYIEWMQKFGPNTQHLIINEENIGSSSKSMYKMQYQLSLLNSTIFPLFDPISVNKNKTEDMQLEINNVDSELNIRYCKPLDLFYLRPSFGLHTNKNVEIDPKEFIDETVNTTDFCNALETLKTEINTKTESKDDLKKYPRLVMLGTGSSIPNKIRNTSGILLQLDEDHSIILDCGESTVHQIFNFFGESKGHEVIKSIKAIYISHLHPDHHIGLIGILKRRERLNNKPILLLAPEKINVFLKIYHNRFEPIENLFELIPLRTLLLDQPLLQASILQHLHNTLNISKINTVFVKHCMNAFGVAITLKNGQKICYSGDTMPCDNMIQLAKDCFLLIHEATMDDHLLSEAIVKRHSTISQAIEIGEKANANFTLLTHFSQRYSKLPILPKDKNLKSVGISYDFMMISLLKVDLLAFFYPALCILFKEYQDFFEEKAFKRELRKDKVTESKA